jgi:hypothetical protein
LFSNNTLFVYFTVAGEDDKHKITARCNITMRVQLHRRSLMDENVLKGIHEFVDERNDKNNDNDDVSVLFVFILLIHFPVCMIQSCCFILCVCGD